MLLFILLIEKEGLNQQSLDFVLLLSSFSVDLMWEALTIIDIFFGGVEILWRLLIANNLQNGVINDIPESCCDYTINLHIINNK